MKFNKMVIYRLLLNVALFLLPIGIWYACDISNYGWLFPYIPRFTWRSAAVLLPLCIQIIGWMISLMEDRFRPFVYGAVLPLLYCCGLTLYHLPLNCYNVMARFIPSARDNFDLKWLKLKKMGEIFMHFDFLSFGVACVVVAISRLIVVHMWKKLGKKPLLPKEWKGSKKTPKTTSTVHGSARFSTLKEIKALNTAKDESIPVGGIVDIQLEDYDSPSLLSEEMKKKAPAPIFRPTFNHGFVVARTGGGKGVGIIVPTLLDYQGSFVVTDIKGENYAITADHRRKQGRIVYVLDAFDLTKEEQEHGFNVLSLLKPEEESVVSESLVLAKLMCPLPPNSTKVTEYFYDHAASLIQCFILAVLFNDNLAPEEKNLGAVYDFLTLPEEELQKTLRSIALKNKDKAFGAISSLANGFIGTAQETWTGIAGTAKKELAFLLNPEIRRCMARPIVNLQEIVYGKADLYLCLPAKLASLPTGFTKLVFGVICNAMENAQGDREEIPLLFLLDEMPALGYMPQLPEILAVGRGFGVRLLGITQDFATLQKSYPTQWKTFLSQELCLFFGVAELEAAEYVSKRLGRKTVITQGKSSSLSHSRQEEAIKGKSSGSSSEQEGASSSEAARSLLEPDEVMVLGDEVVITFAAGKRPFLLQRLNYLTHPHYKGKFNNNPLHERKKNRMKG